MIRDGALLIANARLALSRPLRFGDEAQIKAVRFLANVEAMYQHLRDCEHCLNWCECPDGWNMGSDFDVQDAAWALIVPESSSPAATTTDSPHLTPSSGTTGDDHA